MALKSKKSKSNYRTSSAKSKGSSANSLAEKPSAKAYTELASEDEPDAYASTDDEAPEQGPVSTGDKTPASKKNVKKNDWASLNETAVVYVGRIPHGFHEAEISQYFGQFGEVKRVRLPRSKQTGNIRHYGFVEFAEPEVAKVVCETMDNYLLFGHLLKVKPVPPEKVKSSMFRYRRAPSSYEQRLRAARKLYERRRTRDEWESIKTKAEQRARDRIHRLKELGIELSNVARTTKK